MIGLIPNLTKAPYDDVNVRKGISYALNRDDIAETASEGNLSAAGQTGLILPNQEQYLDPSIPDKGMITQDTDRALAEFAKSGYEQQGGKLVKDGKQLEINLMTANGYSDWLRAAQQVQRDLGKIGIKVQIQAPQPAGTSRTSTTASSTWRWAAWGTATSSRPTTPCCRATSTSRSASRR